MSPLAEQHEGKFDKMSESELELYRLRHSMAHVMATAVMELYPGTKLGFGPPVDNGFYYDFQFEEPISVEDLPAIEKKMRSIINQKQAFEHSELSIEDARKMMVEMDQDYKIELIDELRDLRKLDTVSLYRNGKFVDICEGPHVEMTSNLPATAFKLDSVAGAYWRGDEKNTMLTRIYAFAFKTKQELKQYIVQREEALKRDHRKLGQELDIFHICDEVGKGLPLWLPNGTVLRDELEKLARDYEFKYGYQRISTPDIGKDVLYKTSGHLAHYEDSMFPAMRLPDDEDSAFYLKPMNCPHHNMVYKARPRSYKDLPLRFAEHGHVYRYERSGELAGLLRVRGMTMNDAHIYCTEEQLKDEFKAVMQLHLDYYELLGMTEYYMRLSISDKAGMGSKYHDNPEVWAKAEKACIEAMDELGLPYEIAPGEAAFYGPKVDVQIRNVIGREETASTNQVDFVLPERFDMTYVGADGNLHRPVILHRAPLGTHERFIAFLIEHYGGAFPTWMAPVQVRLIPVSADQMEYAEKIRKELFDRFVRVEIDDSTESFNKKIRNGAVAKIPILLVLGGREAEEGKVTIRRYKIKQQQQMLVDEFVTMLMEEIRTRKHVKPE